MGTPPDGIFDERPLWVFAINDQGTLRQLPSGVAPGVEEVSLDAPNGALSMFHTSDHAQLVAAYLQARQSGQATISARGVRHDSLFGELRYETVEEEARVLIGRVWIVPQHSPPQRRSSDDSDIKPWFSTHLSADGVMSSVEEAVRGVLGYSPSELEGTPTLAHLHPQDQQHSILNWIAVLEKPSAVTSVRQRLQRSDGTYRWLEATLTNKLDDPSNPHVAADYTDITDEIWGEADLFITLADALPLGTARLGHDGSLLFANDRWLSILGLPADLVDNGQRLGRRQVKPEWLEQLGDTGSMLKSSLDTAQERGQDLTTLAIGQRQVLLRVSATTVDPRFRSDFVCTLDDITDQLAADRAQQQLAAVVETTSDLVLFVDNHFRLVRMNQAARTVLGSSLSPGEPTTPVLVDIGRHESDIRKSLSESGRWSGEIEVRPEDRRSLATSAVLLSHPSDDSRLISISLRDMTDRQRLEQTLAHQATHDALTKLPNRNFLIRALSDALERAHADGSTTAVLFIDLDRLKLVNDGLGHSVGDIMLEQVAERLRNAIRPQDVIARFGGDEFVVVCSDVAGADSVIAIAARMLEQVQGPMQVLGTTIDVGLSVGVAMSPGGAQSAEDLLSSADLAMYAAKRGGRGRYCLFDQRLRASNDESLQLTNGLREAITSDQIEVRYKSVLDIEAGTIVGLEATPWWQHQTLGPVKPESIASAARDAGITSELDSFLIRDAVELIARTDHIPDVPPPVIGASLSSHHIGDASLGQFILDRLDEHGLTSSRLVIEIADAMLSGRETSPSLELLKESGIVLCLRGFGTGTTALASLVAAPISAMKIDPALTTGISTNPRSQAVVEATISLSRRLRFSVIAVDVDDAQDLAVLAELGVRIAHGRAVGSATFARDEVERALVRDSV